MKNFKRNLGVGVSAIALSLVLGGPARAADEMVAPVFAERWEGLYLGGHLGYAQPGDWSANSTDDRRTDGNLLGGLQAGYNWQNGDIVWGVQGDISATGMGMGDPDYVADEVDFLGTIRGRLGMVFGDILLYGTAGAGFMEGDIYSSTTPVVREQFLETVFVAGAGAEVAVDERMSFGAEILHFGNTGTFANNNGSDTMSIDGTWSGRIFMNVKMDGGGSTYGAEAIDPETFDLARWDGLYIGGHFGYGKMNDGSCRCTTTEPFTSDDGFVGGMQVGHNWQDGDIVWGLEGDISATQMWTGHFSEAFAEIDYLASLRGRLGMEINEVLVYATGGVGFIGGGTSDSDEPHELQSFFETTYVVGGGFEVPLDDRVSIGAEALYYHSPGEVSAGTDPDFVDLGDIWSARLTLNVRTGG